MFFIPKYTIPSIEFIELFEYPNINYHKIGLIILIKIANKKYLGFDLSQ